MTDIAADITENAQGPKKVTSDGVSIEQHSIVEQIEADRYVSSKNAVASASRGFVMGRFKPGGAH